MAFLWMAARCVSAHNEFIQHNKEYHMKALLSSFQQYRQPPSQGFYSSVEREEKTVGKGGNS